MSSHNSKIPKKQASSTAGVKGVRQGEHLQDEEISLLNQSVKQLRDIDPCRAIKALTRGNGVFSTSVHSYVQLAMSGYVVTGFDSATNKFSKEATRAAKYLTTSTDTLQHYTKGYADKQSIDGFLETALKEVVQTGALCTELVLHTDFTPHNMVVVPTPSIRFKWNKRESKRYPVQVPNNYSIFGIRDTRNVIPITNHTKHSAHPIPGVKNPDQEREVTLDRPTIFYSSIQQNSGNTYATPLMEAALQNIFVFAEFVEDIYKILKKAGHNRLVITLNQEKIQQGAPDDARSSADEMIKYLERTREQVEHIISCLNPEDALVIYDTAQADTLNVAGEKQDYTSLLDSFSGMLATSLKTMPSILGMRIAGSQSLSNTESLIYLKQVASIQPPVETVMSRMLTLAMRLNTGFDGYVKFKFKPISLRPEAELSAHRSVHSASIYKELAYGMITDDYAAHLLDRGERPEGAPDLMGTFFMDSSPDVHPADLSDNTGAQERSLSEGTSSGTPVSRGGGDN
jgi:hypothetical protein